jgi:hypothetical protein
MEEAHQSVIGAIKRASDKCRDVRRPDQSMPRNYPDDLHVIIGKAEGRRGSGAP